MSDAEAAPSTHPSELVVSGVVLSALSLALVLDSASEEPFTVFRWADLARIMGLNNPLFHPPR